MEANFNTVYPLFPLLILMSFSPFELPYQWNKLTASFIMSTFTVKRHAREQSCADK